METAAETQAASGEGKAERSVTPLPSPFSIREKAGRIEKLAIEIEEIALGVFPGNKSQQELILGKSKKIQELARRRREKKAAIVAGLVCHSCDLHMVQDSVTGKYGIFRCARCGIRVGIFNP